MKHIIKFIIKLGIRADPHLILEIIFALLIPLVALKFSCLLVVLYLGSMCQIP